MRLTKLKIAGFKSFVDPTNVSLPGQLVGVVGPNGCGKSNIMDAVRWVLGESKASELRGESMQDVIFNGSSQRKPVSRASVELVFDNSLGRAAGQWSQYTELSVKRVLTRNGQSDYYINNLRVRRKDITDLFLGTGLGPRAYAIIGQGMISRIIEAKPEELRVFLEEAAGVSRYKERRKETEGRLADTRDNLARVEDIRQELAGQIERLGAQAAVARKYHELNEELTHKQQLLWLLRRNDARAEQERAAREIEKGVVDLEAQTAVLRETEARLEETREAHFAASDALHQAQSELYTTNADVARLETELRHQTESRAEQEARLLQLTEEARQWQGQAEQHGEDQERWQELALLADARVEQAGLKLETRQERLPQAEETQQQAQEALNVQRGRMAQVEQQLQVQQAHRAHAQRSLQIIAQRRERLDQELANLQAPDDRELEEKQEALALQKEALAEAQEQLAAAQQELVRQEGARRELQERLQQARNEAGTVQARRAALEQLQQRVQGGGKVGEWLRRQGLGDGVPLWKLLQVAPGWEEAVEAVLRERLNALAADEAQLAALTRALAEGRPPAKCAFKLGTEALPAPSAAPADSLLGKVRCTDPTWGPVLAEWLAGVGCCDHLEGALARRGELAEAALLACPGGHLVSRHGLLLFAPDATEHGLLERQREIDSLGETLARHQATVEEIRARLVAADDQVGAQQTLIQGARRQIQDAQNQIHNLQMETLKLGQLMERFRERREQIENARTDLAREEEGEREQAFAAEEAVAEHRATLDEMQGDLLDAKRRLEDTDRALREEREALAQVERELREAEFSQRECASKLQEIAASRDLAERQGRRVAEDLARCRASLEHLREDALAPQLQAALDLRVAREEALAACRDALETATQGLRALEEQRLKVEQSLNPLRDKISELKLKEQAAALNVEQLSAQLLEVGADEAALTPFLENARATSLQPSIGHLQKAILELGAVNLAALEELDSATQRKEFLDAQAEDLTTAMETLENAIRRIDRETRELLQATFDTVNRHFGQLFPTLFGGGEARLIMTGDEILDAGVQVMAQPPGKKNSTIHLLSGGEKALTAIALVFSMFQLNPAPFCLLDEVDAPLDDSNTERFCDMVKKMSSQTQFLYISHSKIAMEIAEQLVGVTMQESGVSRVVEVDIEEALRMREQV